MALSADLNDKNGPTKSGAKVAAMGCALSFSAILMATSIGSPNGWLGWVALLPLFFAIRVLSPLPALLSGSFWGISFFAASSIVGGSGVESSVGSFLLLLTIPGLYAGLCSRITRRVGFSPLMLGLGWVAVEFALSPLSLHHGLLAGTVGDGLLVRLVGNLAGYVLVAFIVAYVTASLLSVLTRVYVAVATARMVATSGDSGAKTDAFELPIQLLRLISRSRPRAPPI